MALVHDAVTTPAAVSVDDPDPEAHDLAVVAKPAVRCTPPPLDPVETLPELGVLLEAAGVA